MAVNPVGLVPSIVVHAGDGPGVLVNRDITSQIIIGTDSSIIGNNSTSASILDPLVGIPVDGKEDIYAATLTATNVQVDFIKRAKQWNPSPAQAAAQISALGLMKDSTGVSIKGSTDAITPAVNAPSYGPSTLARQITQETNIPLGMKFANQNVTGEIASLIATGSAGGTPGGVPLLRNEAAITSGSVGPLGVGASGNASGGPFSILAPSYDLTVTVTAAALVSQMNGQITLQWKASDNTVLAQKSFSVVASVGGHQVSITGPVRGVKLTMTFVNSSATSPATNLTFTYKLVASARLAANDLCRTITGPGTSPESNVTWAGTQDMDFGILANANPVIASSSVALRGLNMYNGPVLIQALTPSGTNDLEVQIEALDNGILVNYPNPFDAFTDTHGVLNADFLMPQYQCSVNLVNHNAASKTCSILVSTQEPNVN